MAGQILALREYLVAEQNAAAVGGPGSDLTDYVCLVTDNAEGFAVGGRVRVIRAAATNAAGPSSRISATRAACRGGRAPPASSIRADDGRFASMTEHLSSPMALI